MRPHLARLHSCEGPEHVVSPIVVPKPGQKWMENVFSLKCSGTIRGTKTGVFGLEISVLTAVPPHHSPKVA